MQAVLLKQKCFSHPPGKLPQVAENCDVKAAPALRRKYRLENRIKNAK